MMTSYHPVRDETEHHLLHDPKLEEILFGHGVLTKETRHWVDSLTEEEILFLLRSLSSLDRISLFRAQSKKSHQAFLALRPSEQTIVIPHIALENLADIFAQLDSERKVHIARHVAHYAVDYILPFLTEEEVRLYKEHSPDRRDQLAYWVRSFSPSETGKAHTEAQLVQSSWTLHKLLKYLGWLDVTTNCDRDLPQVLFVVDDKQSLVGWIMGQKLFACMWKLRVQYQNSESACQTDSWSVTTLVQDIMDPLSALTFPCYPSTMLMSDVYQDLRNALLTMPSSIHVLPVINNPEDRLVVGYLRLSDVLQEVLNQSALQQATFHHETALASTRYSKASAWFLFRKRIGWLCLLIVTNLGSSFAIQGFETILEQEILLAAFIPLLIDTGGNIGNQMSTMIVTALHTRDIGVHHWWVVLQKEVWVSVGLGLVLAMTGGCLSLLVSVLSAREINGPVAIIVGASLFCMAMIANSLGLFLPIVATSLGVDPAVSCGPILTTVVDITGILIFLSFAQFVLSQQ